MALAKKEASSSVNNSASLAFRAYCRSAGLMGNATSLSRGAEYDSSRGVDSSIHHFTRCRKKARPGAMTVLMF